MIQPAEYLRLKVSPSCCKWCFSLLKTSASRTLQPRFSNKRISLFQTCGKDCNLIPYFILPTVWARLRHWTSLMSSHLLRIIYEVLGTTNPLASSFCPWFSQDSAPSQPWTLLRSNNFINCFQKILKSHIYKKMTFLHCLMLSTPISNLWM